MTLREKAEAATVEAIGGCTCHDDYKCRDRDDPQCVYCNFRDQCVDAMVKFAREHAENACEEMRWNHGNVAAALRVAEESE